MEFVTIKVGFYILGQPVQGGQDRKIHLFHFINREAVLGGIKIRKVAQQEPECIAKIPRKLPMYIFSGGDDPVHGEEKDIDRMLAAYRAHGVEQLDYKLYPGGRHEMFNETNKEEVMQDLLTWLARHL